MNIHSVVAMSKPTTKPMTAAAAIRIALVDIMLSNARNFTRRAGRAARELQRAEP